MQETNELEGIFKNGYGYIPKSVMKSRNISIKAKAVYAYLCTYAGKQGTAYPGRELMCYDLQIGQDTLNKCIKELVKTGFIFKKQQRTPGNKFDNNLYTINFNVNLDEPLPKNAVMENLSNGKNPSHENSVMEVSDNNNTVNGKLASNNNNNTNNNTNNNSISIKNREDKNSLQDFKSIISKYINDIDIINLFSNYIDFRKTTKKPITNEIQVKALVDSLATVKTKQGKIDCLNYSLRNNYTDIYPERYIEKDEKEFKEGQEKQAVLDLFKGVEEVGYDSDDNDEDFWGDMDV